MNSKDFDHLVKDTVARTASLLISKGAEYAGDADRLANFKRNAARNGHTVLEEWMTYWNKHIDSIHSYMARVKEKALTLALQDMLEQAQTANRNGEKYYPSGSYFQALVNARLSEAVNLIDATLSEPIEGRFDDNINYSFLCQGILKELREEIED